MATFDQKQPLDTKCFCDSNKLRGTYMATPTLYILAGLPASGKTTLAQLLAADLTAVHLRIDTIEQAQPLASPNSRSGECPLYPDTSRSDANIQTVLRGCF